MKLIRILVFPIALIYDVVTRIRNLFFDLGVFSSTSFQIPIIAVGNLSVGGTGKTPQIEYLIRLLSKKYQLAVLSRGYGRSTKGYLKINQNNTSKEVGDEPLQFYRKFKQITVAVDEQRVRGVQTLLAQENPPNLILLDDAFQHRKITAGFYLLLTKYDELFVDDFLLPTGGLRESARGAKRAHAVVVSKCPANLSKASQDQVIQKIRKYFKGPVFFSGISYAEEVQNSKQESIGIEALKDFEVILVTGIAKPAPLVQFLKEQEIRFQHLKFKDHHEFTTQDLQLIKETFLEVTSAKKIILTTEKDFVRLSDELDALYYIEITTKLIDKEQDFDKLFLSYLSKSL
ncbi:tetraacyldisaccharide 4'-kinase [Polaribacter pacificus]|uniref:Tetraacyldisaccharide 4'-kinase n=1 Tax=Polaribacter pacificus TaxID=1775173 RepID=A0A917I0A3_9FLAO|nr:tetraacyldisaccharide 4'-kinase [Polaribacter pacificus]GGH01072.1 tetraacyldisaccharide 4'-kinase [Polaribacter pacificus]